MTGHGSRWALGFLLAVLAGVAVPAAAQGASNATVTPSITAPLWVTDFTFSVSPSVTPYFVAGVDLDGGGGPADILVHDAGAASLLLLRSDGGVRPIHTVSTLTTSVADVVNVLAFDWDGPGVPRGGVVDLLVANRGSPGLRLLVGDGPPTLTFSPPALPVAAGAVQAAVMVDVDGDALPDALACENNTLVVWYKGDFASPPTFSVNLATTVTGTCRALWGGDVNGDGLLDFAVCTSTALFLSVNVGAEGQPAFGAPQALSGRCLTVDGGDGAWDSESESRVWFVALPGILLQCGMLACVWHCQCDAAFKLCYYLLTTDKLVVPAPFPFVPRACPTVPTRHHYDAADDDGDVDLVVVDDTSATALLFVNSGCSAVTFSARPVSTSVLNIVRATFINAANSAAYPDLLLVAGTNAGIAYNEGGPNPVFETYFNTIGADQLFLASVDGVSAVPPPVPARLHSCALSSTNSSPFTTQHSESGLTPGCRRLFDPTLLSCTLSLRA